MAAPPPPPPARGMMSLYADLLGGGTAETEKPAAAKPEAAKNPALRFQPIIRRTQQAKAKPKPKTGGLPTATTVSNSSSLPASTPVSSSTTDTATAATATTTAPIQPPARSSLADWTGGDGGGDGDDYYDDDGGGGSQKWPQRGGRKRKKKRLEERQQRMTARDVYVDWDELYDPARPTNLDAYMNSDERIDAARDWKTVLYAHRWTGRQQGQGQNDTRDSDDNSSGSRDDDNDDDSDGGNHRPPLNNAFAPPPPAAFAPPASYDMPASATLPPLPPPSPPRPDGLVISKPPIRFASAAEDHAMNDGSGEEGDDDNGYEPALLPGEPQKADGQEAYDERRANRPGQAGFAARLMAKYGWTRGSGLGADSSGIINPLRHKKTGKGGAGEPAFGRIVGGERPGGRQQAEDKSEHVSRVIVLRNMVTGLPDLADEVADGQLVQDIGEECGEQYGRIERVYVDVPGELVFIQFTEAVSALRAVNALNGRIFNGNAIVPSFYDADKFDEGVYE
ncbi:hypothetical protein SCUCBS95973_004928 [Sporothrix curviconia]|uniref:G-patch domain-containing protein n=1 Tax=Sporothrix curviconia TaxID=1260050 RepID=A0ABP0BT14_9PEZI